MGEEGGNPCAEAPDGAMNAFRVFSVEFVGTFFFVFISTMSTMIPNGMLSHLPIDVSLVHGIMIFILSLWAGPTSGGYFNPALTIGLTIGGACNWIRALIYIVAQLLGGVLGSSVTRGMVAKDIFGSSMGGATMIASDIITPARSVVLEALMTSVLVVTYFSTVIDGKTKSDLAALAIGLSITALALGGGFFTGTSLNPARSLGPVMVLYIDGEKGAFEYHWIYWLGPIAGGAIGAVFYKLLFADDENSWRPG